MLKGNPVGSISKFNIMGLNLNLSKMFGVSNTSTCPKCRRNFQNGLDDFDIECNPIKHEKLSFTSYCSKCDTEFEEWFKITMTKI